MEIYKSSYVNNINTYNQNMKKTNNINQNKPIKDSIQISKEAKVISQKLINNRDDINNEKIEKIKKEIENGTYKINYEEVAKKILTKMRG